RENLKNEGITENVFVTGNTVIDAFQTTVRAFYEFKDETLRQIDFEGKKSVLITAHRRENWGQPLENICKAIKRLALKYSDMLFIYPVHLNPVVQDTVKKILGDIKNVFLIPPVDVEDMHNIMD